MCFNFIKICVHSNLLTKHFITLTLSLFRTLVSQKYFLIKIKKKCAVISVFYKFERKSSKHSLNTIL